MPLSEAERKSRINDFLTRKFKELDIEDEEPASLAVSLGT